MTVTFAGETLPQAFACIPDPRRAHGVRASVAAIRSLTIVALLSNPTSIFAVAEWAARQTRQAPARSG
ncbi:MAG: transposase family protein [Roseiflexus sp.]|nr:transposase family protein [Roseiflexus sp.]